MLTIPNYAYEYWDNQLKNTQMGITLHRPYHLMVIRRGECIEIGFSYGDPLFRLTRSTTKVLRDIDVLSNHIFSTVFVSVNRVNSKKMWGKKVSAKTSGGWVDGFGSGKVYITYKGDSSCEFKFSNLPLERHFNRVSAKKDRETAKYVLDMVKTYMAVLRKGDSPFPIDPAVREAMGTTLPYHSYELSGECLYQAYKKLGFDKDALYQYLLDYYRYNLTTLADRLGTIFRNMESYYRASGTVKYLPTKDETFGI